NGRGTRSSRRGKSAVPQARCNPRWPPGRISKVLLTVTASMLRQSVAGAKRGQILGDQRFGRVQKRLRRILARQAPRFEQSNAATEQQGLAEVVGHKHDGFL